MRIYIAALCASLFASASAPVLADTIDVYKDGPVVEITQSPEWQRVTLKVDERLYLQSKGFLDSEVRMPPGDHVFTSPRMARVNGREHFLLQGEVWDKGAGYWIDTYGAQGLVREHTFWVTGWILVDAETGLASDIPVTGVGCGTCGKSLADLEFNILKPKRSVGERQLVMTRFASEDEATAFANAARDSEVKLRLEDEERRRSENPLKQQIGTEVCQGKTPTDWTVKGYTESVSSDNGRIQIRVIKGVGEERIIWADPTEWELCAG